MNTYRLDIYYHSNNSDRPDETRTFQSPNHVHAANCCDDVMGRRPRNQDGLLYDTTSGRDEYVVTISGEM